MYLAEEASAKKIGQFTERCLKTAIHGENVILINEYNMNVANFKGVIKQNL